MVIFPIHRFSISYKTIVETKSLAVASLQATIKPVQVVQEDARDLQAMSVRAALSFLSLQFGSGTPSPLSQDGASEQDGVGTRTESLE